MSRNHDEVSAFEPELDRDLIARMNEARSSDELGLLTRMATARLRGRGPKAVLKPKQRPALRVLAFRAS